jgi:phage baseplate assembly protein W
MNLNDPNIKDFVGQGMIFPLQLQNGKAVIYSGFELLESSIRIILSWPIGTRFMLGEFGSNLYQMLHEPNDDIALALVKQYTKDSLDLWEKRIIFLDLDIVSRTNYELIIKLTYKIRGTQLEKTMVFPYYQSIPS